MLNTLRLRLCALLVAAAVLAGCAAGGGTGPSCSDPRACGAYGVCDESSGKPRCLCAAGRAGSLCSLCADGFAKSADGGCGPVTACALTCEAAGRTCEEIAGNPVCGACIPGYREDAGRCAWTGVSGCRGVDFLFVVDNSASMADEQSHLIASFPGFVHAITSKLGLDDYRILVVDTDEGRSKFSGMDLSCSGAWDCCTSACFSATSNCRNTTTGGPSMACPMWQSGCHSLCDGTLGSGQIGQNACVSSGAAYCTHATSDRFVAAGEADLPGAFACMANVGVAGDGHERAMEAMMQAVGAQNAVGGCNAGFLRSEAILVVTFITDEEDDESAGNAAAWKQALVAAKGGDENAVVVLGVFGDNDLPGGICQDSFLDAGASAAPKLRQFMGLWDQSHAHYCSVCLPDYTSCFLDAVSIIDTTCDAHVVH